jgi:hypothetical protein
MSAKVEYGPFELRHAEYLEGQYSHGLSSSDVDATSAYIVGPRFRRLFACFGIASGDEISAMFPDFDNPHLAFFTHRPDGPVLPMTFCKVAKRFISDRKDTVDGDFITSADDRFRNAENWIRWLGFSESSKTDAFGRKVFECQRS